MPAAAAVPAVTHYENFPVASWLCPPELRAPIAAIYHYARCADDLADEGDAPAEQRLRDLASYRAQLHQAAAWAQGGQTSLPAFDPRWAAIFAPLAVQMRAFALPPAPLLDLLDAFEQDVRMSASAATYASLAELLHYCRRSANPVGRLLLHLYAQRLGRPFDAAALAESDAICTALQLINFWQDLSVDIPRGRYYLPADECARHDLPLAAGGPPFAGWSADDERVQRLLAHLCEHARATMQAGQRLPRRLPGRIGWELRLVMQGALSVLAQTRALGAQALHTRPTLRRRDAPAIIWRCLRM